jgi:hypothetical protein
MVRRFHVGNINSLPSNVAPKPLDLELLEPRQLLAADGALNVFARFEGQIATNGTVVVPIAFKAGSTALKGGTGSFAFLLSAAAGSTLDPATIGIRNSSNQAISPSLARPDIGMGGDLSSLTVAELREGTYTLLLSGGSHGAYSLEVLLLGDLNGDRVVNGVDTNLLNAAYGSSKGQPQYSLAADANRDGVITSYDRSAVLRNQGDRVAINPLTLSSTVSPVGSIFNGVIYTNTTRPKILGQSVSGAVVRFDIDGDGFDDGVAPTDAAGRYSGTVTIPVGTTTVRVQARDSFGQVSTSQLTLLVDTTRPATPTWTLAPESDSAPLGDSTTTYRFVNLNGSGTEPGVRLDTGPNTRSFTAAADGSFRITDLLLQPGTRTLTVRAIDLAGNIAMFSRPLTRNVPNDAASPAFAWNSALLEASRLNGDTPPQASRAFAMVAAAMYDALNAINGASSYLYARVASPTFASAPAALIAAARKVMEYLYAPQTATFTSLYQSQLAAIPADQSRADGIAVGEQVAAIIIALRQSDGSRDYTEYFPSTDPGLWQPTGPSFAPALLPNWATLDPFAMNAPDQFRPDGPWAISSSQYAADLNEVKSLGSATSTTRTAEQTNIARFWADGAGTYTPAGHWNQIATSIAQSQNLSLFDTARLLAQLNVAMADAAVVAWDAKYTYNQWRPITAIRNGDQDGNAATEQDRNWTPLVNTPPFPDYVSGHSTFSGAAERILTGTFGANFSFSSRAFNLPGDPQGAVRTFNSFSQAAEEASVSRVYGGIHFRQSCEDGLAAGRALGDFVLAKFADLSDRAAPVVTVNSPEANTAHAATFSITGRVVDGLSAVTSVEAQLDGLGAWIPLALTNRPANNGSGEFSFGVSVGGTGGLVQGMHTLRLRASDSSGNQSQPLAFSFTIDTAAPDIQVTTPLNGSTLDPNDPRLTGTVAGTGSAITELCYRLNDGADQAISFDNAAAEAGAGAFDESIRLGDLGAGTHTLTVRAKDAAGNETTLTRTFVLAAQAPLTITRISPVDGAGDIGVTQRPRIDFSRPVDPATLNAANLFLSFSGQSVPTRIVPSADGMFAWLFPMAPMPGASVITLTINGGTTVSPGIRAATGGLLLDGDEDGTEGGTRTLTFTTVSTAPIPGTTVTDAQGNQTQVSTILTGTVADPGPDLSPGGRDDVQNGPDGVLMTLDDVYTRPLVGVEVYIIGRESERVFTDASGRFTLTNVPAGSVKLIVNGRTATSVGTGPNAGPLPSRVYFPEMTMDVTVLPGVTNYVMSGMRDAQGYADSAQSRGVYLPRIQSAILETVSPTQPTIVEIQDAASPNLTPQQRQNLMIEIQPGSLVDEQGNPIAAGQVGISTVPSEMVRDMLPPGLLEHTFDITVQAPGVAAFTSPATMTFPNVFNAAPGTKLNFLSFDHTSGRLVIEGTATVSVDGTKVVTDDGTGITKPGWHGLAPGGGDENRCKPRTVYRTNQIDALARAESLFRPISQAINSAQQAADQLHDAILNIESLINGISFDLAADQITVDEAIGQYQGVIFSEINAADSLLTSLEGLVDRLVADYQSARTRLATLLADCGVTEMRRNGCVTTVLITLCERVAEAFALQSSVGTEINGFASDVGAIRGEWNHAADGYEELGHLIAQGLRERQEFVRQLNTLGDLFQRAAQSVNGRNRVPSSQRMQTLLGATSQLAQTVQQTHIEPTIGYRLVDAGIPLRMRMGDGFSDSTFLPANTPYRVLAYDAGTNRVAQFYGVTSPSGQPTQTPVLEFMPTVGMLDSDGDGLVDLAEEIIGTRSDLPDSDADGVDDTAEVQAGGDPLDGRLLPVGSVSSLSLPGPARDITIVGAATGPSTVMAYIATGPHGLVIVDVTNPRTPRETGAIDLPGTAVSVAVEESLAIAAVALDSGGLALVNVADTSAPSLLRTIPGVTQGVVVRDGIVYAAMGSEIRSYDLATGDFIQSVGNSSRIVSIARDGNFIYALDEGKALRAIELSSILMLQRGTLNLTSQLPRGGARLSVAAGIAYVGMPGGFQAGLLRVSVSNPSAMSLLRSEAVNFAGTMAVPSGSGAVLGIASLGGIGNVVHVFREGTATADPLSFLTQITLPAAPEAIALGGGLAFIANGAGGLQVVNFLSVDNAGVAPALNVDVSRLDIDPARPGIQVQEGSRVALPVTVRDDGQVRNVEALLNGTVVRNDLAFPWEVGFQLPVRTASATNATLQVRASDMGGNRVVSSVITVELVEDTTAPTIVTSDPVDGSSRSLTTRTASFTFSEPVDADTVNDMAFVLRDAQNNTIAPENIQVRFGGLQVYLTYPAMAAGEHTITIDRASVTDLAGNPMGTEPQVIRFRARAFSSVWALPQNGDWENPANWSDNRVPSSVDDVLIEFPGITVTIRSNAVARQIEANGGISIASGSLVMRGRGILRGAVGAAIGTSLTVDSPSGDVTMTGALSVSGVSLYATGGGRLIGAGLTSYTNSSSGNGQYRYLRATGAGSVLSLPNLVTITNGTSYNTNLRIEALAGGRIEMPSAATIQDPNGGDSRYRAIYATADGPGSTIDLSGLQTFSDTYGNVSNSEGRFSQIRATGGGVVSLPTVGSWSVYGADILANGSLDLSRLTSAQQSLLTVTVATDLNALVNLNGTQVIVSNGAAQSIPGVTAYANTSITDNQYRYLQVTGAGSVLSLPNLVTITNGTSYNTNLRIEALAGGRIEMPSAATIQDGSGGDYRYRAVWITADANNSLVDLSSLSQFRDDSATTDDGNGRRSRLTVSNSAVVRLNQTGMSQMQGVTVSLAGAISGSLELLSNGRLSGAGSISGDIRNGGTITIGAGSTISVGGNFTGVAGSVLAIDVAGVSTTQRGRLDITGTATLGGTFRTNFVSGYVPAAGASFANFLTFASSTGSFSLIDATNLPIGRSLVARYNPNDFSLELA